VTPGGPDDALVLWLDPDDAGDVVYIGSLSASTQGAVEECSLPPPTDVPEVDPARLRLAVRPNPISTRAEITFALPASGPARLTVFDALGRKVVTLLDGSLGAGPHRMAWDGRGADGAGMPAGVYLVRLQQGTVVETRKTTLIR
jgi:hypothetical protein